MEELLARIKPSPIVIQTSVRRAAPNPPATLTKEHQTSTSENPPSTSPSKDGSGPATVSDLYSTEEPSTTVLSAFTSQHDHRDLEFSVKSGEADDTIATWSSKQDEILSEPVYMLQGAHNSGIAVPKFSTNIKVSPATLPPELGHSPGSSHTPQNDIDFIPLTVPHASTDIPGRPAFIPFIVPYLCASAPYDHLGFWTYPQRHGWIIHATDIICHIQCPPGFCNESQLASGELVSKLKPPILSHADGRPVLPTEKATFLQAWLFFGVLDEVSALCGLEINVEQELIVASGENVSTEKLNGLSELWFNALKTTDGVCDKVVMERIMSVGRQARLMLTEEKIDGKRIKYTYGECRVFQSLEIVVHLIGLHLLSHIYVPGFSATAKEWGQKRVMKVLGSHSVHAGEPEGIDQLADFANDELEEKGWCLSELEQMSPKMMIFASLLERPRLRDHKLCGERTCEAYQTDENTYKTQHVHHHCACEFATVDTQKLVDVLAAKRVPKIVISNHLELEVVGDDEFPYIALSHVWADGLGNPTTNSLPKCQLLRLRKHVSELFKILSPGFASRPAGFWMDTLCIPVEPRAKQYRRQAIQLLGKTFSGSIAVLILDREIEIVDSRTTSFMELGLRILCSGWSKRLWTLEEAALASESHIHNGNDKIYFQMRDGPFLYHKYDRDRRLARVKDDNNADLEIASEERHLLFDFYIMLELGYRIPSIRTLRNVPSMVSRFEMIYASVEHRSTSRIEDVPVCMASILGLDVSGILSASTTDQRMAKFYIMMRDIPSGVLWCGGTKALPRLSISPFRWALSSITDCGIHYYMGWKPGICDAEGLHIQLRGFTFMEDWEKGGILPQECTVLAMDGGINFRLMQMSRGLPSISPHQDLALIFREQRSMDVPPNTVVVVIERRVKNAVDGETVFYATIIGHVHVHTIMDTMEASSESTFRGAFTSPMQRWCIT